MSVFAIHSYISPHRLWGGDFWHMGDSVMPWDQALKHGLNLYTEFIPNSGSFGMIDAFIREILTTGGLLNFDVSNSVMYFLFSIALAALLTAQLPKSYAFLIGLFFIMHGYNRILFIIVHILILTLPQLRKRLLCWFAAWLFFGLLGILFYPLNGIAVMVGSFPLGVCLFWNFKNKQGVSKLAARGNSRHKN